MNNLKRMRNERGFTLIELLVVIVILGILAAVVVFAVGGLTDKGEKSSCKIDTRTIRTAEEAYFAKQASPGTYGTMTDLVNAQLLSEASTLHGIALGAGNTSFTVYNMAGSGCTDATGTAPPTTVAPTTTTSIP